MAGIPGLEFQEAGGIFMIVLVMHGHWRFIHLLEIVLQSYECDCCFNAPSRWVHQNRPVLLRCGNRLGI